MKEDKYFFNADRLVVATDDLLLRSVNGFILERYNEKDTANPKDRDALNKVTYRQRQGNHLDKKAKTSEEKR